MFCRFAYAVEENKLSDATTGEEKLNSLSSIVDQAILSLKTATDCHDKIFQELVSLLYIPCLDFII